MSTVLQTIRSLLEFKDFTTISEIASTAGLKRAFVLNVVNQNGQFVWRNRRNGRITKVDPKTALSEQLWASGNFYRITSYGAWSHEGDQIILNGHEDLRKRLLSDRWTGGLGDSWKIEVIEDTEENRKEVEAAGIRPWSEAVIDDSLWREVA
ncbi:hypothetical protein ACNT8L_05935 [Brucella intermedia]|uniref:hypothetical protein n=1 Tax=Brucella intermedia TaxID=94625 RepID=UPI003AB6536F